MAAIVDEPREALSTPSPDEPQPPRSISRGNVHRFQLVAVVAVVGAGVPYLWVLWDLWTGSVDPLRINESKFEPGSVIYDVQARALMHGHLALPPGSIGDEAFVHLGRTYTYFGLFPSVIRIPILLVTHSLDGHLSALSLLAAWVVTAVFASLLLWRTRMMIRGDAPLGWAEAVSYGFVVFSVLAGSVLVSLASTPNAYVEDEAWGLALACGSFFALLGVVERPSWGRVTTCGALVLLTNLNRGTSGYGCILATILLAVWFALGRAGPERKRWAVPVLAAGLVAMFVGSAVDYAKFNQFFGYPVSEQLLYKVYGFAHVNGGKHYSLHFLPATLQAYLSPGGLRVTSVFPYLTVPDLPNQLIAHTPLFNRGNSASVPASMPLLFAVGVWGVICVFAPRRPVMVRSLRVLLASAAAIAGAMLIYGTVYERFLGDFMPLLVVASAAGAVDIWHRLNGKRHSMRTLVVAAVGVLALFEFVANMGIAVVPQINWTQAQADNYLHAVKTASDITGHPLSNDVVKGDSFPTQAPTGTVFIKGRCDALFISDEAVPNGFNTPWLPVEQAPHTPICHSLLPAAKEVAFGTAILLPGNGAWVGSHVLVLAATSGPGTVSSVRFLITRDAPRPSTVVVDGRRTGGGWSYLWNTTTGPEGMYTLKSVVRTVDGSQAVSPVVTVTVGNPSH